MRPSLGILSNLSILLSSSKKNGGNTDWEKFELSYEIPIGNVRYIQVEEFKNEDYHLVLPNTDKVIDFLISQRYHGLIHANNKRIFQEKVNDFGKFDFLRTTLTDQFSDDEKVMMKPSISSGGYSSNPLCYTQREFREVKDFLDDSEFLIQEFVPSFDILLLSFVSNGKESAIRKILSNRFRKAFGNGIVYARHWESNPQNPISSGISCSSFHERFFD